MIPAPPRTISSAAQAWDLMRHDVTLRQSLMTRGFNEQRQKDLLALGYEERQKGNAGYYLHGRVELEIRDTNERAQALYDACCEVWEIHGLKRDRVFYRAVFDNCLQTLFGTRHDVVASELQQRDQVMGRPGNSSAAQGSLTRRMDQLRATWNQKLEKEARDSDTRERVARERAAQLRSTVMPAEHPFFSQFGGAAARNEDKPQAPQLSKPGRKQLLLPEFVRFAGELWKQKQSATSRVSINDLLWIAQQLDTRGYKPPADYLEKTAARDLKNNNSKNAHSKAGPILSWSDLVAKGDRNWNRAMRRVLCRCAGKCP